MIERIRIFSGNVRCLPLAAVIMTAANEEIRRFPKGNKIRFNRFLSFRSLPTSYEVCRSRLVRCYLNWTLYIVHSTVKLFVEKSLLKYNSMTLDIIIVYL